MNYLAEIIAFEKWTETHYLSTNAQLLWYKLMALANKSGWAEYVQVGNHGLIELIQAGSENTLIRARNQLIQNGLLIYEKGKKGSFNKYCLMSIVKLTSKNEVEVEAENKLTAKNEVYMEVETEVETEVYTEVETNDIYKQNKTKQKLKNKKEKMNKKEKPPSFSELIHSYSGNEDLRKSIEDFIEMRKSIKKPLTQRALSMLFSKLDELTAEEPMKIKILEQSIFHNWQGVFPLKEESYDDGRSDGKVSGGAAPPEKPKYNIQYTNELPMLEVPGFGDDLL